MVTKSVKSQDYYEMLGISRSANQEDIRKAYEICKHTYQDDSLATYSLYSEDENRQLFILITEAYEILIDPSSRKEYDSYLSRKEGRTRETTGEGERMVASMIGVNSQMREESRAASNEPPTGDKLAPTPAIEAKVKSAQAPELAKESAARVENFIESVEEFTGQVLKKVREFRGISLEDLADITKIRKAYLVYLEEENFKFLPAPVYIKGFVANVATTLELPAKQVADDYMQRYNAGQEEI